MDVTVITYRQGASVQPGRAAQQSEGLKSREYKSKVDGMVAVVIPAAFELGGKWGEGFVSLLKKLNAPATREGRNIDDSFAALWKRRLSITVTTATMCNLQSSRATTTLSKSMRALLDQ